MDGLGKRTKASMLRRYMQKPQQQKIGITWEKLLEKHELTREKSITGDRKRRDHTNPDEMKSII